jgi:hypothetical protein
MISVLLSCLKCFKLSLANLESLGTIQVRFTNLHNFTGLPITLVHPSLFCHLVNYEETQFYRIGPEAQL